MVGITIHIFFSSKHRCSFSKFLIVRWYMNSIIKLRLDLELPEQFDSEGGGPPAKMKKGNSSFAIKT